MKHIFYFFLIFTLISCNKNELNVDLENAYMSSAKVENDTLEIESFEILKTKLVDLNYVQSIQIKNLNNIIELSRYKIKKLKIKDSILNKNVENRKRLIQLQPQKKDEHILQLEYDEKRLKNTNLEIEKTEDEIAIVHQRIVLIKAEFRTTDKEYKLIDFVFKGKINSEERLDTLTVIKMNEEKFMFLKDGLYVDYKE